MAIVDLKAANKLMTKGGNNIRTVGLQISNKKLIRVDILQIKSENM